MKPNIVEIKPCPFCGSHAFVGYDNSDYEFIITCDSPVERCPVQPKSKDDEFHIALEAWNTRADQ